ncbi:hypothetical protein BJ085DRAFT_34902 [Dimargaris cristalligena]|uniref:SET domain-containing protein n=1 Tax=Dimargaris cristalligena TaxID=215637 RepID=A0A4V1J5J8_9FUNG|nr:hypothetical protein BJ085DRAFT_34902 [Dimargaris cristalligena]|eukprot:RKP39309.1 hypothetical protein BJ085DRAFT_34902 [Dimargaris cristalligena]
MQQATSAEQVFLTSGSYPRARTSLRPQSTMVSNRDIHYWLQALEPLWSYDPIELPPLHPDHRTFPTEDTKPLSLTSSESPDVILRDQLIAQLNTDFIRLRITKQPILDVQQIIDQYTKFPRTTALVGALTIICDLQSSAISTLLKSANVSTSPAHWSRQLTLPESDTPILPDANVPLKSEIDSKLADLCSQALSGSLLKLDKLIGPSNVAPLSSINYNHRYSGPIPDPLTRALERTMPSAPWAHLWCHNPHLHSWASENGAPDPGSLPRSPIPIVNQVDNEPFPIVHFIETSVLHPRIQIPSGESVLGCNCGDVCDISTCSCILEMDGYPFRNGLLSITDTFVYECNQACSCAHTAGPSGAASNHTSLQPAQPIQVTTVGAGDISIEQDEAPLVSPSSPERQTTSPRVRKSARSRRATRGKAQRGRGRRSYVPINKPAHVTRDEIKPTFSDPKPSPPTCPNRIIQQSKPCPGLEAFKTRTRGWGIRTRRFIPQGTFVGEYCGEIIDAQTDRLRNLLYDQLQLLYTYQLDYGFDFRPDGSSDPSMLYCSGNIIRVPFSVDYRDRSWQRIAFFSLRDIHPSEEITLDYHNKHETWTCLCGAPNCRSRGRTTSFT